MNKFLEDWSKQLDELEIQLNLDDTHVSEYFEQRKEKLKGFIEQIKGKVSEAEESDEAQSLKAKIEHLQVQLALGRADSRDAFEAQKDKLEKSLHEVSVSLKSMEQKTGQKLDDSKSKLSEDFDRTSDNFQTQLDMMRVQYALGKAEARDQMEEARKELKSKVHEMKVQAEKQKQDTEDKWENFSDELSESIAHFKKALKSWFD